MPEHKQYSLSAALCLPADEVISYKLKHESFTRPFYYARMGWSPTFTYKVNTKYPDEALIAMRVMPTYIDSVHPLSVICYDILENNFIGITRNGLYGWH